MLQPQTYFPIRPSRFDRLSKYYGVNNTVSGYVSWKRYSILLDLAESLRSKLALYGNLNAIELQSYMWVVSYLIEEEGVPTWEVMPNLDFSAELKSRVQRASEKERIGLLGERFIYEIEKSKLDTAGRSDLSTKVRFVSAEAALGFDILSFAPDGQEIHIEVKTTSRSRDNDDGFWLSDFEKETAERDETWIICRVWSIDREPTYAYLGNIVREKTTEWKLTASSWYIRRN